MAGASPPYKLLTFLSYYNLVGGVIGLFTILAHLGTRTSSLTPLQLSIFGYGLGAFLLSAGSYVAYHKRADPTLLGVYAILQLPLLRYGGFKYLLNNGLFAYVGIEAPALVKLKLEALYFAGLTVSIVNKEPAFLGLNVVSLVTLFYLLVRYHYPGDEHMAESKPEERPDPLLEEEKQGSDR
jgi:hypothetical protein